MIEDEIILRSQIAKKSTMEIQIKEKMIQDEHLHSLYESAQRYINTCQAGVVASTSLLLQIGEFAKMVHQNVLDILEFGPFYRDVTNIVENEANITRKISKLQDHKPTF